MAITKIHLKNFKSFADSGEIPLAPLTVIFGRNNTGKSSILQSFLLLAQTLDSADDVPRLNLRGPFYAAGTYADLVHQHKPSHHIYIGLGVASSRHETDQVEFEFASDEPQPPRLVQLDVKTGRGDLKIQRARGHGGPYELSIDGDNLRGEKLADFRFLRTQFLPVIADEHQRRGRPNGHRNQVRESARQALKALEGSLRSLRAVGAFRRQPERRYEYAGRTPNIIDPTGEHAVNSLLEDATRRGGGELIRLVNRWLSAIGRVKLMKIRSIAKGRKTFEIRLRDTDSGRWANFADVGFGIGQALPVLIEGLRTPKDGTFLVQEPEIHLHPDAQLSMADFLIDLVGEGRQVIVESHSEPLLLRIRSRVLGSKDIKSRLKAKDVAVIHVSKTVDGATHAESLEVDSLGQINGWPRGFMEEATEERLKILQDMAEKGESAT